MTEQVILCGGTILDDMHVVTAAHCLFNPSTRAEASAADVSVLAGSADDHLPEAGAEVAEAASLRIHPYFKYAPESPTPVPDDVAVIALTAPLTNSERVQPIGTAASAPAEGSSVLETGFGRENHKEPADGLLHSLTMALDYSREHGGEYDAVFTCASSPSGSVCIGDSGSGLTSPGGGALLLGTTDNVLVRPGEELCAPGALAGFANDTAPEIADFLAGDALPPRAPHGGGAVIRGVPRVGERFTCEPGTWFESPTFTLLFRDGSSGAVLQEGPSREYALVPADAWRSIYCEVRAANAGGTGVGRTPPLGPVIPAPPVPSAPPPAAASGGGTSGGGPAIGVASNKVQVAPEPSSVTLASAKVAVASGEKARVRLRCSGLTACRGRLTLELSRGSGHHAHAVEIGATSFSIPAGRVTTVTVALKPRGRSALHASHGHMSVRLSLVGVATLPLHPTLTTVRLESAR